MSSAFALVRFPDGRVRAGVYHGTSDVLHPWLWDSIEEAWDHRRPAVMRDWNEPAEGVTYEVTVFSDYGGGFYWPARAAWNVVLDNLMPVRELLQADGQRAPGVGRRLARRAHAD